MKTDTQNRGTYLTFLKTVGLTASISNSVNYTPIMFGTYNNTHRQKCQVFQGISGIIHIFM